MTYASKPRVDSYFFGLEGNLPASLTFLSAGSKTATQPSNLLPAISPANVLVAAITYVNKTDNSNLTLELLLNGVLSYSLVITNARWAVDTLVALSPVILTVGDQLSVRAVADPGPVPTGIIVWIYFGVIESINEPNGFYSNPTL